MLTRSTRATAFLGGGDQSVIHAVVYDRDTLDEVWAAPPDEVPNFYRMKEYLSKAERVGQITESEYADMKAAIERLSIRWQAADIDRRRIEPSRLAAVAPWVLLVAGGAIFWGAAVWGAIDIYLRWRGGR